MSCQMYIYCHKNVFWSVISFDSYFLIDLEEDAERVREKASSYNLMRKKDEESSQVSSLRRARRGADLKRDEETDSFPWNDSMENTIA